MMEKYDHYFRLAKKSEAEGDVESAKRNYYLAAKELLLASKNATPELKKARISKANRLNRYADELNAPRRKAPAPSASNEEDAKPFQCVPAPDVSFDDIVGLEEAKREIKVAMIYPLLYPEKYQLYRKASGGGILLYGPPGTGKTMLAKAVAHEVQAKFYLVRSSDIVSKWVGESEKNIAALFSSIGKEERSIIFIDEMDTLFASRGQDIHNDRRVNEFLQQIDGFTGKNPNLLLLGSTNKPWSIDNAALRSGRFSTKIYIRLPNFLERRAMFERNLAGLPIGDDVDLDRLASLTNNFSGADIALVCDKAKERPLLASFSSDVVINVVMDDFLKEIHEVRQHIDLSDIRRYEKYAGVHSQELEGDSLDEIAVQNKVFEYADGRQYQLEFKLSGIHNQVYLSIAGRRVNMTKNANHYVSEPFSLEKPGRYQVDVYDKTWIGSFLIQAKETVQTEVNP